MTEMESATGKSVPILVTAPYELRTLDAVFAPKGIAVCGVDPDGNPEARVILSNLIDSPFGGSVFPVCAKEQTVLGIASYPDLRALEHRVDLAVIANPAEQVPEIIGACIDAGVKAAIIVSGGFRETGRTGLELERKIAEQAQRGSIRIIGPNSMGVLNPRTGLNASPIRPMPRKGGVAFLSQSGALGASVLDWSRREQVGFSAFVATGSMLDVGWGDLIYYLGDDSSTRSIIIYMESLGDARSLLSAAREVALVKPIIVLKAGQTEGGKRAAASHSGALTGDLQVLDAAFRRTGVLRVNTIGELFYMAEALAKQPRAAGRHLTIVTNSGASAVLAVDELIANGGELTRLTEETQNGLHRVLPQGGVPENPVDLGDDARPDRYAEAFKIVADDKNGDGVLVILTPQVGSDPAGTAQALSAYSAHPGRPLLASWMGGQEASAGEEILNRANIPTFSFPDTAARVFTYMWRYAYNLRGIYETPSLPSDSSGAPDRAAVDRIIQVARQRSRTLLTEFESKEILAAYRLPVVKTCVAQTEADAVRAATEIGYPVVLKIHSETISHKAQAGGVRLDLGDEQAVRRAFEAIRHSGGEAFQGVTVQQMIGGRARSPLAGIELILGSALDRQFGPVILFGAGGRTVELVGDTALALPPLNTTLARRMMEQTRIYRAISELEAGRRVDLPSLEHLIVRFSQLVIEQPYIREIDINPLFINLQRGQNGSEILALDARMVLYSPEISLDALPRPAIRPYPAQYVYEWSTRQGMTLLIRPIRPEDEPLMASFHGTLSERSVYLRYLQPILLDQRVAHDRLARICFNDYDREFALVAERRDESGRPEIVGIGRLSRLHKRNDAEFAILVSDSFQGHGLGTELLRKLVDIAREEHIDRVIGYISAENRGMLSVVRRLGFRIKHSTEESEVDAVLDLTAASE